MNYYKSLRCFVYNFCHSMLQYKTLTCCNVVRQWKTFGEFELPLSWEFFGFRSSAADVLFLLGHGAAFLGDVCQTCQEGAAVSSSRVEDSIKSDNLRTFLIVVTTTLSRNVGFQTDTGKHSFVNRAIKLWNQLPAEAQATFPYKSHIFRTRIRKVTTSDEKWRLFEGWWRNFL
jgi:hypothetical protein